MPTDDQLSMRIAGLRFFNQSDGLDHETRTDERSRTRADASFDRDDDERRTTALAAGRA